MRLIIILTVILGTLTATAQSRREELREHMDSVLKTRYERVNYDTNFIARPKSKLTLKARVNVSGYTIRSKGTLYGFDTRAFLHTKLKTTVSFGVTYRGLSVGLSLNPARFKGRDKDFEVNVNLYNNRFCIDAIYQNAKTLSGYIDSDRNYSVEGDDVDMQMLVLSGYYVFNNRRFSFPAAFTQSYVQRRSAGSWLLGLSYQAGTVKTTDNAPDFFHTTRFYVGHFGIGGGYAYNLTVRDKWLFHLSFLPTWVIFNRGNMTVDGERVDIKTKFPALILNENISVVYHFSPRYFLAATAVFKNTLYRDRGMIINQDKWRARMCFGVRF